MRYLAGPAAASHLARLAGEIGLTAPQFLAGEHVMADKPLPLRSTSENLDEAPVVVAAAPVEVKTAPVAPPDLRPLSPAQVVPQCPPLDESVMTPEGLLDELLGHEEPARRRWLGRRPS